MCVFLFRSSMNSMMNFKKLHILFAFPVLALLFSCSARIEGVVREGGAADITISTALEPRAIALIRSIRGFMGEAANAPILDGPAISQSIAAAPGVLTAFLVNSGPTALDGTIAIANVGDFLAAGDAEGQFITFIEGQTPGSSSIVVSLDRDSAPDLISRLAPELTEYLSVLMAPVVLGENISRQEYLNLIAMVYGRPLADEIAAARVRASIQFPRQLTAIQGGTAAGNRAEFDIALVDLLVMQTPLRYEISW